VKGSMSERRRRDFGYTCQQCKQPTANRGGLCTGCLNWRDWLLRLGTRKRPTPGGRGG
jgi:hypothetical protein